jgi:phosphohistidine phosphatase
MYLYLIRHGIAEELDPQLMDSITSDELRSLTKIGRKKIIQIADRLYQSGLKFDLIITSPLVRARQTAELLADRHLSSRLEISPDLAPAGNIQSWLTQWKDRSVDRSFTNIALVGHEPNLSEWAELLIFGRIDRRLILKKGGTIGLKFPIDRIEIGTAQLHCLIPPKYCV